MKRTSFLMMVFAAMLAGLVFASCKKDKIEANNNNNNGGGNGEGGELIPVEWVDLGLPSGLLWAKCNLGATTPQEYGNYYSWGGTQPKNLYRWDNTDYCTTSSGNLTALSKYNTHSDYGTPDNLTTLEAMDDAASVAIGGKARTPTRLEWVELMDNTTMEMVTENNVYGAKFTASNGNSIFLPAAGYRWLDKLSEDGNQGCYWSSSLYEGVPSNAWYFKIPSDNYNPSVNYRYYGYSIRPVRAK